MTVTITKPAINIREKLTELKATQGYEERQFHFDDLVTNGTFDTDLTGWTDFSETGGSVAHSSSGLALTTGADSTQEGKAYQVISTVAGSVYRLTATKSGAASRLDLDGSGQFGAGILIGNNTTTGVDVVFVATSTTTYINVRNLDSFNSTAYIDNISVYPSDGTDVAFTMPKGWKPLHVYDDGVLQREGSAEDYEVTFDGFNYYVKPTVANPGARNTVIGVRA